MRIWIFLTVCLMTAVSYAIPVIRVEGNGYNNLGKRIGFWEDTSRHHTIYDLEALPDDQFVLGERNIFNGGAKGSVWWVKIRYEAAVYTRPFLVIDYANIDSIEIFYRDTTNHIHQLRAGSFVSSKDRQFVSSEYVFSLPDVGGNIKEVYLRLTTGNTLIVPVKLVEDTTLTQSLLNEYRVQFLYIGICIALLFFNLFMLVFTGDGTYGYYIVRIIFAYFIFVIAYLEGFGHFFGDRIKEFITLHAYALAAVGYIATILLNNRFLKVKVHLPKATLFFNILIGFWIVDILLSVAGYRFESNRLMQVLFFITSLAILYSSILIIRIVGYRKKYPLIIFYIIGWISISLSIFYIVPAMIGIVPLNSYSINAISIAGVLEGIFISLALLGEKLHLFKDGKRLAEEKNIQLIRERNAYLEEKVNESTRELKEVVHSLEKSNAIKNKLFSIIAHDMRSPVSGLIMMLNFTEVEDLSNEDGMYVLKKARTDIEGVQKILDNLLQWSLSQMEMHTFTPEPILLPHFMHEHISIYLPLAKRKGIEIDFDCHPDTHILIDKNQFSLIVRNLIDNAIKFTPHEGSIKIGLDEDASGRMRFYIANTGGGMSQEAIDKICTTDQLSGVSYGTANEKGTGLGLQLCKEFIRNMNSEMKIESVKNEKTIFSFCVDVHA